MAWSRPCVDHHWRANTWAPGGLIRRPNQGFYIRLGLAIKVGTLILNLLYLCMFMIYTLNKVFLGIGFGYDFIRIFMFYWHLYSKPSAPAYESEEEIDDEGYEEVPHLSITSPQSVKVSNKNNTRTKTRSITVPVYGRLRVSAEEFDGQGYEPTRISPLRDDKKTTIPLYGAMFVESSFGSSQPLPSGSKTVMNTFYGRITLWHLWFIFSLSYYTWKSVFALL